jgi:hypothetical protein
MSISHPTEGLQLLAKAIRGANTVDTIGDIVTFTVKVISPPIFRSAAEVADLTGESKTPPDQKVVSEGDPEKIQQFQGRIESEFFMSPHLPIPDPCNLSVADSNNAQLAFAYAALHTTCFTPLGWNDGYLKVGDRCRVTMKKGDFKMDLQYATVDSLQSSYLTVQSEASKNECSTLAGLFEDFSGTLGDIGDGCEDITFMFKRVNINPMNSSEITEYANRIHAVYPQASIELAKHIVTVANQVGADPGILADLINFESGQTFKADTRNPTVVNGVQASATGLIQFTNRTAREFKTTTAELAAMTPEDQMNIYVRKYFVKISKNQNKKLSLESDLYMAVFQRAAIGKGLDYKFSEETAAWNSSRRVSDYVISVRKNSKLGPLISEKIDYLNCNPVGPTQPNGLNSTNGNDQSTQTLPAEPPAGEPPEDPPEIAPSSNLYV